MTYELVKTGLKPATGYCYVCWPTRAQVTYELAKTGLKPAIGFCYDLLIKKPVCWPGRAKGDKHTG